MNRLQVTGAWSTRIAYRPIATTARIRSTGRPGESLDSSSLHDSEYAGSMPSCRKLAQPARSLYKQPICLVVFSCLLWTWESAKRGVVRIRPRLCFAKFNAYKILYKYNAGHRQLLSNAPAVWLTRIHLTGTSSEVLLLLYCKATEEIFANLLFLSEVRSSYTCLHNHRFRHILEFKLVLTYRTLLRCYLVATLLHPDRPHRILIWHRNSESWLWLSLNSSGS